MISTKYIFRSSLARTLITILGMIIGFFMMPFIVEKLGDHWYGIWTIITALLEYYYLVDFGLATAVTRYVSKTITQKDSHSTNVIINTSLIIYSFMSVVICIITAIIAYLVGFYMKDPESIKIIRLVIFISGTNFAIQFPFKAFAGIVGAYMRYDLLSLSHFFVTVSGAILTLIFLSMGYGIVALAVINFITAQISYILFFLISKHLFSELKISLEYFKKEKIVTLFNYSLWSFLSIISDKLRFRIDTFVIGAILSASFVTHYFIGARLAEYFYNLMLRAIDILVPVFTKYHTERKYNEIRTNLLFITKGSAAIALFGGGVIMVVGKPFIARWMGAAYLDAYPVLVALMTAMIIETILIPAKNVLFAIKKHRFFAILNLIEGILNVVLSLVLIHFYGIWGVALGTMIPLIIIRLFVLIPYVCRSIEMPVLKYYANLLQTFLFTTSFLFVLYFLIQQFLTIQTYFNIFLVAILASLCYIAFLPFVSFSVQERNRLKSMALNKL